ncbi:MAG: hypothetical protein ACRDN9_14885 [Streptosporangiaceae bacterium]
MTATREELHRLVDAVDDDKVSDAAALLREFTERREHPRRRLSFVGALTGGPADLAERHEEYLREQFARPA